MILPRDLYNDSPPERRSRISNNPTLLYSWWCTIFSFTVIALRLSGRYIRNETLFREDKIMALSIIPLMARMGAVHLVLTHGTNNVDIVGLVDPTKIHNREIGSKAVLAARIFYTLFIWMAKFTVSEFLKRITERYWKRNYEYCLRAIRVFLVATFVAIVISTLAECQPFSHYWQVIPDPGPQCRQGYTHLLAMGIADIITDIVLVIFPIPIILSSHSLNLRRKLSLVALFSMSLVLVAITGARIPLVIERRGLQQFRTVFASSEVLAAAVVSNAIILGSFLRDRGPKKPKYRGGSATDSDHRSSTRRPTLPECSSDENLARELGYRTNPELVERNVKIARPAPVADLDLLGPPATHRPFSRSNWQFPGHEPDALNDSENSEASTRAFDEPLPSPRGGRRVSFLDAGGLLEKGEEAQQSNTAPSPSDSVSTHDFAVSQRRRGSRASSSIAVNGRTHQLPNRRPSRLSQRSEDYTMSSITGPQLQDPGGLLSESREMAMERNTDSQPSGSRTTEPANIAISPSQLARNPVLFRHGSLPSIQDAGGLSSKSSS